MNAAPKPASLLNPPKAVLEIAATLEAAGYETWCVGGAVRDALLGKAHLDWDLATQARPERIRALFQRTVPIGVEFGTVAVFGRDGVAHEVTTFRRDVRTDGRHAEVEFGVSLDDDLARRDFTINAIAYSPSSRTIHDPFEGQQDLARKLVRAVGEPRTRMMEDRLRALRALRFASRFGFEIDPATWRAIVESAPFLTRLSRERVKQELEKTMDQVQKPSSAMERWRAAGAFQSLIPELRAQPIEAFRAADAIGLPEATSRKALSSSRRMARLATLFLGLDDAAVRKTLRELRFSNRETEWIGNVTAAWQHLEPEMCTALASSTGVTDAMLRRWIAVAGRTVARDLFRVTAARWREAPGAPSPRIVARMYRRATRVAFRDPVAIGDLAIDGDDLRVIGVAPGPRVGSMLRALLDLVIEDPALNDRGALLDLARHINARGEQ
jgi:tRNA nucleotidyltransferase/poly(A) polymerase